MIKTKKSNDSLLKIFSYWVFFISVIPLSAQEQDTASSQMYFDFTNSFRIEGSLFFGIGFKEFDVFETTDNEIVSLSPGGGYGALISVGYYFTEMLHAGFELGVAESPLSKDLKNADGSFYRTFFTASLRYKFPLSEFSTINAGGGAGYYMSAEMDIDAHKIDAGAHNIYYFKDTAGFHILSEYEQQLPDFDFLNTRWSWLIGLKYYNIAYELESAKSNGMKIPIEIIESQILKDLKNIDGSGIDIYFSLVMHI